ncbi:hypothetical protein F5141DRAFT_1214922 [Pisolithus sp. B1]|nr:hypothetical protein F5141DRAFT_1214922 [Pisolithus sp. B1]
MSMLTMPKHSGQQTLLANIWAAKLDLQVARYIDLVQAAVQILCDTDSDSDFSDDRSSESDSMMSLLVPITLDCPLRYSNYHGSLQNSAGSQANAVYPTHAWGALSLLSTGKAEYVKEVNLILQDMKIELIPSQPMQCYPQKAGMKAEVEQSAPLQSKHYMRAGQTAPQIVLHMTAKVSLGYEWPQEISRVRWKEIICTLPPQSSLSLPIPLESKEGFCFTLVFMAAFQ